MKFFQRFSVRLSLVFLALLLILGIIQVMISVRITEKRHVETDQLVNRHLARDMAREIESSVAEGIDLNEIGPVIHFMMVMNPKIEIYLLDSSGKILAFFAEGGIEIQQDSVDIEPIRAFLKEESPIPLYGTDPRNPKQDKHFSAPHRSASARTKRGTSTSFSGAVCTTGPRACCVSDISFPHSTRAFFCPFSSSALSGCSCLPS